MAIQTINIGTYANDGTGDDLRSAFRKVNENFVELGGSVSIANGANVGAGVGFFKQRNLVNLEFKTLVSSDNSITIAGSTNTVDVKAVAKVENDETPKLGGDLNLDSHYVYGGDVQTTIYGYDVRTLANLVEIIFQSNQNIDFNMGSFLQPAISGVDMNGTGNLSFLDSASNLTQLDFGTFVQE